MNISFSLVFMPYLTNAVVLAKSPRYFHALVALKQGSPKEFFKG